MKHLTVWVGVAAGLCLAGCESTKVPDPSKAPADAGTVATAGESHSEDFGNRSRARLKDGSGNRIGSVVASQGRDGVLFELQATGLPPGAHGVHVHGVGSCDDVGSYTASGGHVGKGHGTHGLLHPGGPHRGDLPNIHVSDAGDVVVEFYSSLISLAELNDDDGAALIIHAERDDHQTQPIGRAGARIACAAFPSKP